MVAQTEELLTMKKALKFLAFIALLGGLYVAGVLIYGTINDFEPEREIALRQKGKKSLPTFKDDSLTVLIWNIGFTGLGEETDFFYDGGKTVIQKEEIVAKNLKGIQDHIQAQSDVDVFLLQEVDSSAKRSHYNNHVKAFEEVLPDYGHSFAINYNVDFVPMPLFEPMGGVVSGLASFSRFQTEDHQRIGFPSQFSWPTRIFFLDRCYLKERMPLENGAQMVIYNTHCSAYDTSGTLVAKEVELLMEDARKEYESGNYVIIGGDWNQCPPNYTPKSAANAYNEYILKNDQIDSNWQWVADPSVPTNRKLTTPYNPDESYTSVIDHYLISPNLKVLEVKTQDLQFKYSDHQPVKLKVSFKN